ncbi:agrin-like protein, partial [Leptotrombidium deliense]
MSTVSIPETMSTSGASFIKPPYLKMMRLNGFIRFTIEIEFQTFSENGIILFNGQSLSGKGDFVSIAIHNGHVEFKFNLGSGPVLLKSHRKIDLQTRVKVVARRYLRDGKLSVSGQEDVTGKSHGTMKNLDLGDYLYLANVPSDHKRVSENIGVRSGLFGCLFSLKIDSKNIDLRNYAFKFSKIKKKLIEQNQTSLCFCDFNCENAFLEPVCGTDFNVYKSECELKVTSCETQRTIHVNNYGTCDDQMIDNPSNHVFFASETDNKTIATTHQFQRDSEFLAALSPKLETMKILS